MIELLTIDDVLQAQKSDPELVAAICAELSVADLFLSLDRHAGKQIGHSDESYARFMRDRKPSTCLTCRGKGEVYPSARGIGTIHPSSANRCVLRLYNDIMGIQRPREEHSPGLRMTFDFGHIIHARVQTALHAAANWDTEAEIKRLDLESWDPWAREIRDLGHRLAPLDFQFQDEVRVELLEALISGGHADGLFDVTLNVLGQQVRIRVVLEIKTAGENDYRKLSGPKEEHLIQAGALYAKALDAPFTAFLYIAKIFDMEKIFTREYVVPYRPAVFEDWAHRKLDPLERAIAANRPPTADATSYECGNCGYRQGCAQRRGSGGFTKLRS